MLRHLRDGSIDFASSSIHALVEEKAGCGTWLQDLRTQATHWSRGMYNLLGIDPSVPPDWNRVEDLIHPDDRQTSQADNVQRFLRDPLPTERDFRVLRPNGTIRWLTSRKEVLFNPEGQAAYLVGVLVDNTLRRDALRRHSALDEHRLRLARAVSSISWTVAADGSKADVPLWRELTGQSIEEAAGAGWLDAVHPDDRASTAEAWHRAFTTKTPYAARYRLRCADGSHRWFIARAAIVRDDLGNVREWVGTCIDVQDLEAIAAPAGAEPSAVPGWVLRAARGALNWAVQDLAEASGLTPGIIRRLEASGVNRRSDPALERALSAVVRQGVQIAGDGAGGISLKLRNEAPSVGNVAN
jgi:PAS domain S-box-containing protein